MTKAEFLKKAEEKWEELQKTRSNSKSLYTLEKSFDQQWVEFGNTAFQGILKEHESTDRRKKKSTESVRKDRDTRKR